ncbi:MAG: Cys-Gln thioester bond-forming surface protein [Oscillospiraceae bacterium]|nr:Cys-Gln thioester bond-forming surface protein [Oscillospiraceae bacterium]
MTYTKRAAALLLALMMVFTGAVQAFAATQMTMAVIALPRSADTNKGDWGLAELYLMGGWETIETDNYLVYCKDSHSGPVVYCIEPGYGVRTGNVLSQANDSTYWNNYPSNMNPTLSPDGIKTVLGRLLQYGWRGNGNTSWNTTNASHRQEVAELIATQMLVWEVVVGERTLSFSHVDASRRGYDSVMDSISSGNPLYDDIWDAYDSIEYAVQKHTLLPSFMSDNEATAPTHELVWNGSRYEITLTDTNGVIRECGLKTDSTDLKCEISGNKITFYTTNPDVSEILVVAEKEASVNNFLVWTDGNTGAGDQDVISFGQEVNETLTGYLNLTLTSAAAGDIKIIKTAEDNNVSFIEFNIKGEGLNTTAFTDENGEILLEGLAPSEYTITEASYSKYKEQQPQTVIVENGKTAVAQFHNEMNYGALKIVKTADDGNVEGIEFTINGGAEQSFYFEPVTVVTDANGEVIIPNLHAGLYMVFETVPEGYIGTGVKEIVVEYGKTATVEFHNELKKGNLEIIKTSEDGNIEGINFTITGNGVNKSVTTDANGRVLVEGLVPGTYTVTEGQYDQYVKQEAKTVVVEYDKTATVEFHNVVNYGGIKIIKTSEDGKVEGIEFIVGPNTEAVALDDKNSFEPIHVFTDENGVAIVEGLLANYYGVTEVVPEGYHTEKEYQSIRVEYGMTSEISFHNELQRGDIEVTKTSEDGLVEGVKFKLSGTSTTGISVEEYAITNAEGVALFEDIPVGDNYVLEEVETAERYVVPAKQNVKVEWEYVTEASFNNVLKKFNLVLTKTDAEKGGAQGNATLEGAVYGIYKDGELLKSYTTDANGKFTTDYFVCGEGYTVKEITPSKGYLLDETVYTLDVAADNYSIEKNIETLAVTEQVIKGTVQLTKVDKDFPENKLTGAEFEVYVDTNNDKKLDANDTLLGKLTEAERGIYSMSGLVYGGYFVKETVAPKGFILDSNAYYFEIAEDGKTVVVENEAGKGFVNVSQSGSLKIVKTSSDGKVEGFSFRVTSENGYDETFTTDKNGEIFIEDIRLGTYTISEIANGASSNYIMPAAKTANVTADATTVVEMHNVLRETPKTGDTRMPGLWLGITTISTLGAATFFYLSNKKRRNER